MNITITPLLHLTLSIPLLPFIKHPLGLILDHPLIFDFHLEVNWVISYLGEGRSYLGSGKRKSHEGMIKFGFSLVKGKANHPMEDYHVGLFSIYDGHLVDIISSYLKKHLFANILKKLRLGRGGSTVVTTILINGIKLCVENVRDSRVVLSRGSQAIQMTTDHEPIIEQGNIENIVSRAFDDKSLKSHLRSDPDIQWTNIDNNTDILILASDGLWKVMSNQETIDIAKKFKDPQKASKQLIAEAVKRDSKDDISCVVVIFEG
ncbi:hypothetical protein ES288_A13G114400v1 [Gossypium darwinii]|uniref:PPM-type phosphatase domain-containing protein n=1 Tax=Gossypium darwinii TaxID=34276 RepID=A0A5D2DYT8_GOSDA|nr:hypothetical protein ES288_A13G114400v1 [Gossypium darwinii]